MEKLKHSRKDNANYENCNNKASLPNNTDNTHATDGSQSICSLAVNTHTHKTITHHNMQTKAYSSVPCGSSTGLIWDLMCTCAHTHTHTHTQSYSLTYTHTHSHMLLHVHIYSPKLTHTHTHTHTCTHTHTHIQPPPFNHMSYNQQS